MKFMFTVKQQGRSLGKVKKGFSQHGFGGRVAGMFKKHSVYSKWVMALILYSLLVFVWGAWVRISGSGDGCGEHWPFCHGELIPDSYAVKVWIENFHRISTKIYGFFVIGLVIAAFRMAPKGHAVRKGILWAFIFTLLEGLIGAVLVIKGFVVNDDSPQRAVLIALHLTNTFFLMGSLFYTWFVSFYDLSNLRFNLTKSIMLLKTSWILLVGGTGAIAALSTTLFPSESVLSGLARDFSGSGHFLEQLRVLHPLLAVGFFAFVLYQWSCPPKTHALAMKWRKWFTLCVAIGFCAGVFTLSLLSPTWLKLTHLVTAHILWLAFCGYYLSVSLPDSVVKQITDKAP